MDERLQILCRIFSIWLVFDEWIHANAKAFTDYEIDMFKWLVIFSACQDLSRWAETAPEEVLSFIEKNIGGKGKTL